MSGGDEIDRMLDRLQEIKGERDPAERRGSGGRRVDGADSGPAPRAERKPPTDDPADWRAYFPYDEPYPNQAEGIEGAIETGADGGYTVLEGACGSGKTLLALCAGISLVRDPETDYERVFVVTSVKQQLEQFEEDLRAINRTRAEETDPVNGVTLVGKTEMCPYARVDGGDITPENVGGRCADLREATRSELESTDASTLVSRGRRGGPKLATDGVRAPYPADSTADGYCPFYARYLGAKNEDEELPLDFEDGEGHVADPGTVRRVSTDRGFCPHSLMAELQHEAEVVVGNYYHVFSPGARKLTDAVIDDETFLVVDEAHTLEGRVRDLFETSISVRRLETARRELDQVREDIEGGGPAAAANRAAFEEHGVPADALGETAELLDWIHRRVDKRIERTLEQSHGNWREGWGDLPESEEIALRDPTEPGPDELTKWSREAGFGERDWTRVLEVGMAVEAYLTPDDGHEEVNVALPGVGAGLAAWYESDHIRHFREIELSRSSQPKADVSRWDDVYDARLVMHNCLPTADVAARLDEFGGGMLMSATLAPLSVLETVVGLDGLDREVTELQYPLRFPEENRASLVVDTPAFTHRNKSRESVREEYADVIETVAASPGNVLVVMPSYAEATWAAGVLKESSVEKPVLVDESTTNAATQRLKERFFTPPDKVLVTSARGTLTEGVDYAGDRLSAALVCSVPFVRIGPRARAIVAAYEAEFGDDVGFEYALTVPAVRKARQALGRVIRGEDETGVRVLADERYATTAKWNSVKGFLPEHERAEYERVAAGRLGQRLASFRKKQK